jgi:choice-of-anchor B domain-containing protein
MFRTVLSLLLIVLLHSKFSAQELQKIGHLSYAPLSLAGCWHHVDSAGGEWALVGTSGGLSIVDVQDPTQPVERFNVPGITNNWREMGVWAGYAYVGSEAPQSGITIVDLRKLPDTIAWKVWRGDGIFDSLVINSHTVKAEAGFLYVFGGGIVTNGATIADLSDPWNPVIVGKYSTNYVHDGYIRGDTLWTSEIYKGWFGVVDISDKANPVLLATQPTPGAFNHNTGLSDDGKTLFSTDEKASAPLASFDVSNLDNISMLDTYLPSKKPSGEVHNVRVFHNFLINPSYRGQLTIVDATRPANLLETAWDSLGNSLVWDADPYLPSGIILATAKSEGLFVYQKPTYRHAAWLEGNVVDGASGFPLSSAKVYVLGTLFADTSRSDGSYKTGAADPGLYDVYAFKNGYYPATIQGVSLQTNQLTTLDIPLFQMLETQTPLNKGGLQVFPSPFQDNLTVDFPAENSYGHSKITIRLFDVSGKMVAETKTDGAQSVKFGGLKNLPEGAYWLIVDDNNGNFKSVRVVK